MRLNKPTAVMPLLLAAFLVGCGSMQYTQYTGAQQAWPTIAGSLPDAHYAIPVYRGWPDQPYEIIGTIVFSNPNITWNEGDVEAAAKTAQNQGGEAIVMRYSRGLGLSVDAATDPAGTLSETDRPTAFVIRFE